MIIYYFQCKTKQKAYGTRDSQAVSDPSTNRAQRCLTGQIERDGVFSTWYGRKRMWGRSVRRYFCLRVQELSVLLRFHT